MNKICSILLITIFFAYSFTACNDKYEDYSTSPNTILSFSCDTLSLDTLLSTIGSATHGFKIYNRNSKPLLISSISLAGAGQSGFRINVDGVKGSRFSDVEILAKDSLFVFVEVTLKENDRNNPVQILDSVIFNTNAVVQKVILQAYGQDVHMLKGGTIIETDSIFKNDKPYLIYDSIVVREGAVLTIPEGATLYMHAKAEIDVYGTLKIEGSQNKPVTIRGDRLDSTIGVSYDKLPGQWSGIYFTPESVDNTINYAHIRNSQYGLVFEQSDPELFKLKMTNSVLTNVYYNLFTAENCNMEIAGCEFSNAGGALVYLNGGKYSFTQCTLANYFIWDIRSSASLCLKNYTKEENQTTILPLTQADFFNCIVYGNHTSEIAFYPENPSMAPDANFNYKLDYCLIKFNKDSIAGKPNITNYILNEDPKFQTIDDDDFVWNFQLKEDSPAIDTGKREYATANPTDMNGISRTADKNPDRGAYEWTPSESSQ